MSGLAKLCSLPLSGKNGDQMPQVTHSGGERDSPQQPSRKILKYRVQTITLDIIRLKRRRATGRVRIGVFNYRSRYIAAVPSGPARAQSQIGILAVQKKVLVKKTDAIKHTSAVQCGRSARERAAPLSIKSAAGCS